MSHKYFEIKICLNHIPINVTDKDIKEEMNNYLRGNFLDFEIEIIDEIIIHKPEDGMVIMA